MNIRNILKFLLFYWELICFDVMLHKKGFNYMFEKYAKKYARSNGGLINESNISDIARDIHFLNLVCAWYPRKADCIHKTLLGYKKIGLHHDVHVEMVVGVVKFPFQAHAWIRYQGESLINQEDDEVYKVVLSSNQYIGVKASEMVDSLNSRQSG